MSTDLANLQFTLCDDITNIITLDISMLSSLMEHLIFCETNSTLTVTEQVNARINSTKLSKQTFSQTDSLHALAIVIYSASVVDIATTGCKVVFQLTAQLPTVNT